MNTIHRFVATGLTAACVLLSGLQTVGAQAPAALPMQGYLTDLAGAPVDGPVTLTLALYASDVSTVALYSETQSIMVDAGTFTAYLGDGDTGGAPMLDLVVFRDNPTVWVGIAIDAGAELPRFQLGSVPYAAYAQYAAGAETLGGRPATDFALGADAQARVTGVCAAGSSIREILADGSVTCETDDDTDTDTTYSAGSGLTLTGTTFAVDTSALQQRVTGSCPAGQSIRVISATGAVTCEVDDSTTYSAGTGLTLAGTTFSADTSALQARVAASCPAGQSIRSISATGAVTCEVDDGATYAAGTGLILAGTTFSADTSALQARVGGTCPVGQAIRVVSATGAVTCEPTNDVFGTAPAEIHYGHTGLTGQALGWAPNFANASAQGVWLEGASSESGGFYADGDMSAIWSPGDASVVLNTDGTTVNSVLLAIYDEDSLTSTAAAQPYFVFSNFDTRRFATSTGAFLSSGGVWTNTSNREIKFGFTSVDPQDILERLARIEISEWSYIAESDGGYRHLGPMAQDFYGAFGLGYDETSIPTVDADGVALASIQALYARNQDLAEQNARLTARVEDLEARLARLEALIPR